MNTFVAPRVPVLPHIRTLESPALTPQPDVPWADTMVLNPAVIDEPGSARLHMLFRSTGPWPQAHATGKPLPFPIFLGYATSDDDGQTWDADFSRPCLAPRLESDPALLTVRRRDGRVVVNHANGCIEDPRLFRLDGTVYLTTACRLFPPGPYWQHDEPMQCAPEWARTAPVEFGRAARENLTVTVLWEVDFSRLIRREYERAFTYVCNLSDPARGDNRDVFPFPKRMTIDGRKRYACLHRPFHPSNFGENYGGLPPSIFLSAADCLEDLGTDRAEHRLLAQPKFAWEGNRVGASWVPIPLSDDEWLLPYHAKQDAIVGYTQSFMILRTGEDGWPFVTHRCPDRLMFARKTWELAGRFTTPCVFTCGGVIRGSDLIMTYGAADTVIGTAWTNFHELVAHVRCFDADGNRR